MQITVLRGLRLGTKFQPVIHLVSPSPMNRLTLRDTCVHECYPIDIKGAL
jgi:hypothetical protein